MPASNHPGHILPQDTAPADYVDEVLTGQPVSLTEIEDLLYGDDRPVSARLDRLRELADELRAKQGGEVADNDAASLIGEIERAISELETKDGFVGEPGMLDVDPLEHRETMSPDDDVLLDAQDAEGRS